MRIIDAHEIRINETSRLILLSVQLQNEFGFRCYQLKYTKTSIYEYVLDDIVLIDSFELLNQLQNGNVTTINITESDKDTLERLHVSEEDFVRLARMADGTTSYEGDSKYERYLDKIKGRKI